MLTIAERKRLVGILGMLGSNSAGERDNAARLAEELRRQHGATWADLVNGKTATVGRDHVVEREVIVERQVVVERVVYVGLLGWLRRLRLLRRPRQPRLPRRPLRQWRAAEH
jgi:hypothetical protein